jgi:hypothetical protein
MHEPRKMELRKIQVRHVGGSYQLAMAQVARIEATPAAILAHLASCWRERGSQGR